VHFNDEHDRCEYQHQHLDIKNATSNMVPAIAKITAETTIRNEITPLKCLTMFFMF